MDLLSRLDYYAIGRAYVNSRATRIDPAQIDIEGSDINLFVGSTSYMSAAVQRQMNDRFATLWLDSVDGEDLDRWGYDRYRLLRKGASPALTSCTFSRPTAAGGAGPIAQGTKFKTQQGIEYITTQQVAFGVSDLVQQSFVRAVNAGKAYQVGANTIRQPSGGPLFDPSILITNPEAAAGGEDRESDDVFRERIRNFWTALAKGTVGAIAYGATTVPGVVSAVAFEALDTYGHPARIIQLYIADSSGMGSTALAQNVLTELEEWRAGGIYVAVQSSVPQLINIALHLSFQGNVDTATIGANVAAAVVNYVNSLGCNDLLLLHDLGAVLSRFKAAGLNPNQGTIVSPVGDLIPDHGKTFRMRPENLQLV